ncbi:hypothetical protein H3018_gp07 [Bacillus phage DK3]|uniref:Uncharacterized protein n=1 Tax=Bacillus phage DK3 TaxID=2500810 RepID=A0A3T0IJ04_9CAUD|nr:hypothetical protein H3018_gp07 [Bacillus phage DK3]AZU99805.1 hypothetical protein DK3_00007 [Bacillus phage DK3]
MMDYQDMKKVEEIMKFADQSHKCMVDIITIVKNNDYSPEVFKSAIESINRLLDEKGRK